MNIANWDHWGKKRKVQLWEAVALLHNTEPQPEYILRFRQNTRYVKGKPESTQTDEPIAFQSPILQQEFDIAKSHVGTAGAFAVFEEIPHRPLEAKVDLLEFGTWALSNGKILPEGFPRVHAEYGSNPRSALLRHIPKKLEIILNVLNEADSQGVTDTKSLRSLLEQAFKRHGVEITNRALDQFAILIRPDSASAKDGRSHRL